MYGSYKIPFIIEKPDLSISLQKEKKGLTYRRDCMGETEEKVILSSGSEILIQPVEPLNLPRQISTYLLLEFATTLIVEPQSNSYVFITFPVEIGVLIGKKQKPDLLDIFSLNDHKYTLYGDPDKGIICKYWRTEIYREIPGTDPLEQGVMKLHLNNQSDSWIKVNKAVFKATGMKIYYNTEMVSLKANMKIHDEEVAETEFINSGLAKGMKKSNELFTLRKLSVHSSKSVMLEGI
ncbi:MAG: DUF432 domain-containing protein [Candidatus Cloacimonetes bacterium]|nr:DUF432 domain-containing protein [Candidatus Cloacimonadota bacterium]